MRTTKVTVTCRYWGFMLFAPIFHEDWPGEHEGLAPIPVPGLGWLLSLAFEVQQFINLLIYLFNPDACGFVACIWPLKKPRHVTYRTVA